MIFPCITGMQYKGITVCPPLPPTTPNPPTPPPGELLIGRGGGGGSMLQKLIIYVRTFNNRWGKQTYEINILQQQNFKNLRT